MLDLHRLRLLHELQRLGTVSAVAEALSYSPSTVSQQLKVLEREAGTTLFEPTGRRIRLTDAALVLAAHAGDRWATGYPGGGMAALVRRVCNQHGGFEPDVRHETNELMMLLSLVAAGHAVTLLPELALLGDLTGVALRPVVDAELTR